MNSDQQNLPVIFREHPQKNGAFLGEIKLNSPKSLNALSKDMIFPMRDKVEEWTKNPSISLIFLHGEGSKAFCAGGDVKSLYHTIKEAKEQNKDAGSAVKIFFEKEYEIDKLLHNFPKPVVTWGEGVVMGGGLGLFMGSSHRIVTETSFFAMPETHIGLFPDVGGTYFLSRLPYFWGWYLALTTHRVLPDEALHIQFGNLYFENKKKEEVFQFLLNEEFQNGEELLEKLKAKQSERNKKTCFLEVYKEEIKELCESQNIHKIYEKFKSFPKNKYEEFLKIAQIDQSNFLKGSPSSLGIVCEQLKRGKSLNLNEAFEMELVLTQACARRNDFPEGVRALLIDKTKDAKWDPASIELLTDSWIQEHFKPL